MKNFLTVLGGVVLGGVVALTIAAAQSASSIPSVTKVIGQTATVSWTEPTTFTGGGAIPSTDAITNNVYEVNQALGTTCGAVPLINAVAKNVSGTSWITPAYTSAGVDCYAVTAVVNNVESAISNSVQVTVSNPTPNPPVATVQ